MEVVLDMGIGHETDHLERILESLLRENREKFFHLLIMSLGSEL